MDKFLYSSLVIMAAALIGLLYRLPPGLGVQVLYSEKTFIAELHNSLVQIDRAKSQWAIDQHKLDTNPPSIGELGPYLGKWTNTVSRFESLGVNYTSSSIEEEQSDVAILTRDLYFQAGISRFYPNGTRFSLRGRWQFPTTFKTPLLVASRELLIANLRLIVTTVGVGVVIIVSIVFTRRRGNN